jgi:outer membrane protein OmpA-like peptidoglycan-associated protein
VEADQARAQAEAEQDKAAIRAQLLAQLNAVLQTQDTARGLIVNMSDVLFDTGSSTLKPATREKLAKISGIVLAHPGLALQIEGHTDSVGCDQMNQQLSERRADSVRDFLISQGVAGSSVSAQGLGRPGLRRPMTRPRDARRTGAWNWWSTTRPSGSQAQTQRLRRPRERRAPIRVSWLAKSNLDRLDPTSQQKGGCKIRI